ncbi:MAG TPA: rhomboid family intramembrane serine protease [Thermoanaerobaculia bacterium]|nr:rhomboid family intramembrane serine protease [Thermoanaerobaculia bacterium]
MLLIPIGRDDAEIRRHAWVSYTIIALNLVAFLLTAVAMRPAVMQSMAGEWESAFQFYVQHPYLRPPPDLTELLTPRDMQKLSEHARAMRIPPPEVVRVEQAKLNAMVARADAARRELPYAQYGYIPAEGGALKLVSSMFIHAGILHLIGNLLFFYLSGPFVEDVYGRPLFGALYFAGGIVAALTFAARDPGGTAPLVGASGAISAVMGAYLIRFYRSKIEFFWLPFLWRPMFHFRFFLPAFVVLPLWLAEQLWEMQSESGSGVAFSAHVGGFVFGCLVGVAIKLAKFEQKYVDPLVTKQTTWVMDDRLARALEARRFGNDEAAKQELAALLRDDPKNIDALRTSLDLASDSGDWAAADALAARLLGAYVDEKHVDTAREFVAEFTADRDVRIPKFLARAAAFVERNGERDWALTLYERLYDTDPVGPGAVGTLVKTSALLRASGDHTRARDTLQKARTHPACNAEWAQTIDSKLATL